MNDVARKLLERHFDTAFSAPDGIAKLRELILALAMQGKLVEQDPNDQPASELLKKIGAERQQLVKSGKIKAPKQLPPIKPEEVPYELPQGWQWVRLGALAVYKLGKTPASKDPIYWTENGGVPWASIADMPTRGYLQKTSKRVSKTAISNVLKHDPVPAGSLLMSFKLSIGKTAITNIDTYHNEAIISFFRLDGRLKMYLFWILYEIANSGNTKGAIKGRTLNSESIRKLLIPLPPSQEQARIVSTVDQLMARCDELEKLRKARDEQRLAVHAAAIKKLLETQNGSAWNFIQQHFSELYSVKENVAELRKAILQLAVMGRLVHQDPNDPPASQLLKEIEAEKQRLVKAGKIKNPKPLPTIKLEEVPYEVPKGWEWVRLNDALDVRDGTHDTPKYVDVGFPLVTSKNIYTGKLSLEDVKYISEEDHKKIAERSKVDKGDILFAMIGSIGNPLIVDSDIEFSIKNVALFKFFMNGKPNNRYLHYYLVHAQENMKATSSGAVQSFVSLGFLRNYLFPLPPSAEQGRIVACINQLMTLCDTLDQQIEATKDSKSALLRALLTQDGERSCA